MSERIDIGTREIGEIDRPFSYFFENYDGSVTDLTGYTSAWLDYWDPSGAEGTAIAAVTDAAGGVVQFNWESGMTASVGNHTALLWVSDGTHKFSSVELYYNVVNGPGPSS